MYYSMYVYYTIPRVHDETNGVTCKVNAYDSFNHDLFTTIRLRDFLLHIFKRKIKIAINFKFTVSTPFSKCKIISPEGREFYAKVRISGSFRFVFIDLAVFRCAEPLR